MKNDAKQRVTCPSCGTKYRVPGTFLGRKVACKDCGTVFRLKAPQTGSGQSEDATGSLRQPEPAEIVQDDSSLLLGRMALKYGFLEKEQLRQALSYQERKKREGHPLLLGDILMALGMLSRAQLDFLLSIQEMLELRQLDRRFGVIAVRNGFATEEQIKIALAEQERIFKKTKARTLVGDILMESGILTEREKNAILAKQKRIDRNAEQTGRDKEETSAGTEGFELEISEDRLSVFLTVKGADSPQVEEIRRSIERLEIHYGVLDDSRIGEYLDSSRRFDQPLRVAAGKPPRPGTDARIRYHFDTAAALGTAPDENLHETETPADLPTVQEGDLLAERIPPETGRPGIDVYGNLIAVAQPGDVKLEGGAGTAVSEDAARIIATVSGVPERIGRSKVAVVPVLKIAGDVDAQTGHVDFDGAIQVAGTVQSGWRVTGTSLTAGEIRRAAVETAGPVRIRGGVIGSSIKAGGEIRAKYVRESDLQGLADVVVEKEIIDSHMEISGACRILSGAILASRVAAKQGIEAKHIGSEVSRPSKLLVGEDVRAKREIARIREQISLQESKKEEVEGQFATTQAESERIQRKIGEAAQVQDRALVSQRQARSQLQEAEERGDPIAVETAASLLEQLSSEIEQREQELEALFDEQDRVSAQESTVRQTEQEVAGEILRLQGKIVEWTEWADSEPGTPEVRATGKLFEDTEIEGRYCSMKVRTRLQNVRIHEQQVTGPSGVRQWQMAILNPKQEQLQERALRPADP